jgi:hypothetical protein
MEEKEINIVANDLQQKKAEEEQPKESTPVVKPETITAPKVEEKEKPAYMKEFKKNGKYYY